MDTGNKFRFRKFPVYNESRKFVYDIKSLSAKRFPKREQFSLVSQLWRALDSIVLNIAEGSDRGTDKDFAHFLNIANASLNETVACWDIALDNKYISNADHEMVLGRAVLLSNQLTAFRRSLINSPTK